MKTFRRNWKKPLIGGAISGAIFVVLILLTSNVTSLGFYIQLAIVFLVFLGLGGIIGYYNTSVEKKE